MSQVEETRVCRAGRVGYFFAGKLIVAALLASSSSFPNWAEVPGTLTSIGAVHALSNAEASHAIPVACEASVVYSRGYESLLFVQDGDSALFVVSPNTGELLPGDRIFIKGKTQGSFRPLVVASAVTLLHHGVLPKAMPATFDDLIRARFDSRLVTVVAQVRAVDFVGNAAAQKRSARLQLLTDGGHIEANIDSDDEKTLKDLLDDEIEITGVSAGKFDDKMQQTGVVLYVSKLANIRILKGARTRFWALPITPMDQILSSYHVRDLTQRVQVRGTITYYQPGSAVVLQDDSKSLWISTHTRDPLRIGDHAVASGFPSTQGRLLTLTDAEIQDTGIRWPITPQPATWQQLALWSSSKAIGHQNDLVSIEGQVVGEVRVASQDEYVLSADGQLFSAIYRRPGTASPYPPMLKVPLGSRVRVTGICSIDGSSISPGKRCPSIS